MVSKIMVVRVILKIGYYERWFEFENISDAVGFAADVLRHNVPNEDHPQQMLKVEMALVLADEKEDE